MKSRENLLRLKHFQVEDKTRQLVQIDMMIAEFEKMSDELQEQIDNEEKNTGITDREHFAYPTFAKAALLRRENLTESIRDLKDKRANAELALEEAEEELKKAQIIGIRDGRIDVADEHSDKTVKNRTMMIG